MTEFKVIFTDAGLAIMAAAIVAGANVDMTHIAVGDIGGLPVGNMVTLRNEVWRGAVTRLAVSASNANVIECEARIPPEDGDFTVREIGLFDAGGTLMAVGNLPDSFKPLLAEGAAKDMQLRMYVAHDNADIINILIDPNIIMASQAFVNDRISEALMSAACAHMQAATAIMKLSLETLRINTLAAQIAAHTDRMNMIEGHVDRNDAHATQALLN